MIERHPRRTKTVVVLGASYGGIAAVRTLAESLPKDWKILLVDRNSHANHLYVFPRFAVVPGHEHKAFIPLNGVFGKGPHPHRFVHANVTGITPHSITLSRALPDEHAGHVNCVEDNVDGPSCIPFDFAIYALGSKLPAPINLWTRPSEAGLNGDDTNDENLLAPQVQKGTKKEGVSWMQSSQERIARAESVLVVGGGALGIQFASDIKSRHARTQVTLLHSRKQLLPRFDPQLGREAHAALEALGVRVVLGSRLDLSSLKSSNKAGGPRTAHTTSGMELAAQLVLLCTGQVPNTSLMKEMIPESIVPDGESRDKVTVKRTMQVAVPLGHPGVLAMGLDVGASHQTKDVPLQDAASVPVTSPLANGTEVEDDAHLVVPYPHFFCVGDAADAFGAINAGHTAHFQAQVAAKNVAALARASDARDELTVFDYRGCISDANGARLAALERAARPKLTKYVPGAPAIKVSLGMGAAAWDFGGNVDRQMSGLAEDLDVGVMWTAWGQPDASPKDMYL